MVVAGDVDTLDTLEEAAALARMELELESVLESVLPLAQQHSSPVCWVLLEFLVAASSNRPINTGINTTIGVTCMHIRVFCSGTRTIAVAQS
jgi:hypothetical protein